MVEQSASGFPLYMGFQFFLLLRISISYLQKCTEKFLKLLFLSMTTKPPFGSFFEIFCYRLSTEQMMYQSDMIPILRYRYDLSSAGWTSAYILIVKKPYDGRSIKVLQSGYIFFTSEQVPAKCNLPALVTWWQQPIMSDPDKALWRYVHQEPANEFLTG